MRREKCKNSVFCMLFLVSFAFGTICGVLLFRLLADCENDWILVYGRSLPASYGLGWLRPLLLAALLGLVGWGRLMIPVLIFCRGLLMAYLVSVLHSCSLGLGSALFRGLIMLPLFFLICLWSYGASARCRQAQFCGARISLCCNSWKLTRII